LWTSGGKVFAHRKPHAKEQIIVTSTAGLRLPIKGNRYQEAKEVIFPLRGGERVQLGEGGGYGR